MKIVWAIAVSLMLGSVSCAMEVVSDESIESIESVESAADVAELTHPTQELDTEQEADDAQALTAGVYVFMSRESCVDLFTKPCSTTIPTNQCSGATPGAACVPVPHTCWKVIDSGTVDRYRCVAP